MKLTRECEQLWRHRQRRHLAKMSGADCTAYLHQDFTFSFTDGFSVTFARGTEVHYFPRARATRAGLTSMYRKDRDREYFMINDGRHQLVDYHGEWTHTYLSGYRELRARVLAPAKGRRWAY